MARAELRLPKIGMTMQEATVAHWYVGVGDSVTEGDDMCEVDTDKANAVLAAPSTGRVVELLVDVEQAAEFGDLLAVIELDGD
jgi:pyruvate/2-oxoglutarate dehydrogenase complex dihydrolipoamide acyltransferase (E2) component